MLRQAAAPLHPDGWKFVAIGIVATIVLFLLWAPAGWAALVVTLWVVYFFRDPWRVTPARPGIAVSPGDGIVVSVAPAMPPAELGMGREPVTRIGIFLNVFDVHINRVPVAGTVAALRYTKGRFVNASLDKASEHNERMAVRIKPEAGPDIAFVQIAGLVARRIITTLKDGQEVRTGERYGLRVDVSLPPPYVALVAVGQRMVGGETVLAERGAAAPDAGFAH
jgi:phosphatidylserine decarboxylase